MNSTPPIDLYSLDLPSDPDIGSYSPFVIRRESIAAGEEFNLGRYLAASSGPIYFSPFNDPDEPVEPKYCRSLFEAKELFESWVSSEEGEQYYALGLYAVSQTEDVGALIYWTPALKKANSFPAITAGDVETAKRMVQLVDEAGGVESLMRTEIHHIPLIVLEKAAHRALQREIVDSGSFYSISDWRPNLELSRLSLGSTVGIFISTAIDWSMSSDNAGELLTNELEIDLGLQTVCSHTNLAEHSEDLSQCSLCGSVFPKEDSHSGSNNSLANQ